MKLLYVCLLLLSTSAWAAIDNKAVLGFSDWKNQKIRSAYQRYTESQKEYSQFKGPVFDKSNLYKTASRNYRVLEATRKLTIHDYFQMYLMTTYPENPEALQKALGSLNQSQVTELLLAYQKSLRGKTQKLYIQRSR